MDASRLHRPAGAIAALALAFAGAGYSTGAKHEDPPQRPAGLVVGGGGNGVLSSAEIWITSP